MREKKHYVFFVIIASIVCSLLILLVVSIWQQNERLNFSELHNSAKFLADQTTTSLGIITAGITLFTLFGGILSVVNIFLTRDLYKAIDDANKAKEGAEKAIETAKKAVENQNELEGYRLLEEGRAFWINRQYKYAAIKFNEVIKKVPDTLAAINAKYDLAATHVENYTYCDHSWKRFREIEFEIQQLCKSIKIASEKYSDCVRLEGDTHFLLGCFCGQYFQYHYKDSTDKYAKGILAQSIKELEVSIRFDNENADYYRNLAISYGMNKDNSNACNQFRETLEKAIEIAEKEEPLYRPFVNVKRLQEMFGPYTEIFAPEVKDYLLNTYGINLQNSMHLAFKADN